MKRRRFISVSIIGASAIAIPFIHCGTEKDAINKPAFLSQLCNDKSLRELGLAYRTQYPNEAQREKLLQLVHVTETTRPTQPILDEMIRNDFESGKTVVVKGWVLSVTEGRQCALFSFQS